MMLWGPEYIRYARYYRGRWRGCLRYDSGSGVESVCGGNDVGGRGHGSGEYTRTLQVALCRKWIVCVWYSEFTCLSGNAVVGFPTVWNYLTPWLIISKYHK